MKRDTIILPMNFNMSFLSCEKDTEEIIKRLFFLSNPYSESLKRLLLIGAKDCLTNTGSSVYQEKIDNITVKKLIDEAYIRLEPKLKIPEHEEIKSYIIITYDNFLPNATNTEFRDCTINFDIVCHTDYWSLDDYMVRPLKIAGYIDGILNKTKLSGIGELNFLGCHQLILDEELSGYSLSYRAVHGSDDRIPPREE